MTKDTPTVGEQLHALRQDIRWLTRAILLAALILGGCVALLTFKVDALATQPAARASTAHPDPAEGATRREALFLTRRLSLPAPGPTPTAASRSEERQPIESTSTNATTKEVPKVEAHTGDPTAAQWAELRACEASGDYTLVDPPYFGAYQFDLTTWRGQGGTGLPSDAPAAEQDARALSLWRDRGWQPWPVCGYAKWGAR